MPAAPAIDIISCPPSTCDETQSAARLLRAIQDLSYPRSIDGIIEIVRKSARDLSGADGVTFVLPEGDLVYYADEHAIGPLWKGRRFAASACISGWAMANCQTVVIENIFEDPRIPIDAYRPTFVKSLAMVPIRKEAPLGAIGAYWASRHRATEREVELLEALASTTAIVLANAQLCEQAHRAAAVRDEFIGIVAHELRTPLTPLQLQLDSLARAFDGQASPFGRTALHRLSRQVKRLSAIVTALSDVALLEGARPHLKLEEFDLVSLARQVIEDFEADLPPEAVPPTLRTNGPLLGRWDRIRIGQALQNLLSNAVKFGEGKPVEVTVREVNDAACLVVRDHGIGIAPENHHRIFERFERAVSARHFGGFGIGLWAVRQIAEAHHGSVGVASRLGEGATFTMVLPK